MKNILAIGGSNSKKSINTFFATYIANQMNDVVVTTLNWEELILPLYSPDLEEEKGIPENVNYFLELIKSTDGIVLSLAEYNGSFTSAFKNLWDWSSRVEKNFWENKPMFLASTSPGGRGGIGVLSHVKSLIPHFGGNTIVDFSLPAFYDNFKNNEMHNTEIKLELIQKIKTFNKSI